MVLGAIHGKIEFVGTVLVKQISVPYRTYQSPQ
jgi:hypothetical protein